MKEADSKKIAVIGAGIAGLSCAYELHKAGMDVTIFEKETTVGGRMRSREKNDLMFDIGANHLIPLYYHMREYCQELGVEWHPMTEANYGLFRGHKVQSPFQAISWWARIRLSLLFFGKRKTSTEDFFDFTRIAQLDADDAYEKMKQKIGKDATDYLADGFTSAYQFHSVREISWAAALSGMESIQYDNKEWALHRTKGGMSALPEALAKDLKLKAGTAVTIVKATPEGIEVGSEKEKESFDLVVLASTANVTQKIYQNPTPEQKTVLTSTKYAASIVVAYTIPLEDVPPYSLVWTPKIESKAIASYSYEATKGDELKKDGKSLMCVFLHEDFAEELMKESDEAIFDHVKEEFLKVAPWLKDGSVLENHDLERWPAAMPKFYHGHISTVKTFLETGQGQQNVYFCGDYLNSPWTEGALRCGQRVAKQIIDAQP